MKFGEPVALFNGRDLAGWRAKEENLKSAWSVEQGNLVNRPPEHTPGKPGPRTANLRTEREFEDFNLKLEVNVPKGSNSGVYLRGIYEIQVLDCYENQTYPDGQAAAIYGQMPPLVNASRKPGEFQTYDIIFTGPRFEGEELKQPAYATVLHNGVVVQNHVKLIGSTGHKSVRVDPSCTGRQNPWLPRHSTDSRHPVACA